MHIARIELENIKSHQRSTYQFQRGTTVITGENGAGKTSIIEAVAWVLFDLLDYKKEDFVRRGAKKGSVRVTFESGLDEREYIVYRDTGAAYHVTDPRLQTKIADKKEEVFRFLWQHLGLEPGTDLRSLFRQAIGVPQGTFTAIFLEGAAERKVAFDRLLKVEEYRQAAEKLRETSRFVDGAITDARENIARAEGELSRSDAVKSEHKAVSEALNALKVEIDALNLSVGEVRERVTMLDQQQRGLADLKASFDARFAEQEKAEIIGRQAESAFTRAKIASEQVASVAADHERHLAALKHLAELDAQRVERDKAATEFARAEATFAKAEAEKKRLDTEVARIDAAKAEIESLRAREDEQRRIDAELDAVRNRIAGARVAEKRIQSIDRELEGKRVMFRKNKADIESATPAVASERSLGDLENEESKIISDLAQLRTNLARDQKFQSEISDGLCPILSQKCLNLQPGVTLEDFLSDQFLDVKSRISELEARREQIAVEIAALRDAERMRTALKSYELRKAEIEAEGRELTSKRIELEAEWRQLAEFERQFAELEAELRKLADPAARIRVLGREVAREGAIRKQLRETENKLAAIDAERTRLAGQVGGFRDLDKRWMVLTSERDATAAAHRTFVVNEAEAANVDARKTEFETANAALSRAVDATAAAETAFADSGGGYDAERHKREKDELLAAERRLFEMEAKANVTARRQEQIAVELEHFGKIRDSLAAEVREKERLEQVAETATFIRDTLKEAAPRVARNYVHYISLEANMMFREITGHGMRTLKWGEDYAIAVEEEGFERPFQSLSGGEQMAAALSIRLALLKQLSDIRIAFFDEPTANMDAERRENFAQEISRIRHFDQLFVISHDETFDNYVDNVVHIERTPSASARAV